MRRERDYNGYYCPRCGDEVGLMGGIEHLGKCKARRASLSESPVCKACGGAGGRSTGVAWNECSDCSGTGLDLTSEEGA